jgi:hypothetical protein
LNVWTNDTTTTTTGGISASVPSDAVILYRVTPGPLIGISSPVSGAVVGVTPITVTGTASAKSGEQRDRQRRGGHAFGKQLDGIGAADDGTEHDHSDGDEQRRHHRPGLGRA